MSKILLDVVVVMVVVWYVADVATATGPVTLVRELIQFNLAGHPILHQEATWPFDPDVGVRRARQYQEVNGVRGAKAIERLGLGVDGYDRERLAEQNVRDRGHLNAIDE